MIEKCLHITSAISRHDPCHHSKPPTCMNSSINEQWHVPSGLIENVDLSSLSKSVQLASAPVPQASRGTSIPLEAIITT
ncbi:hypothetical protein FVEN_g3418 [Fusarium venenatum]|nr:hypothetical protein FVEN_g3418 [Fusarium venenatum]